MTTIGIDGGISGAVAIIADTGSVMVHDIPFVVKEISGKPRKVFDPYGYLTLLTPWVFASARAFFERGGEIPFVGGDGRKRHQSGMYPYGFTNGQMFMGALALGIPSEIVEPQVWKRFFSLLGKDKEASRAKALDLYPAFGYLWPKKAHHNRAEAVLIAHYGLHH
jgi:crossover junction endodeoxyribonuclease RuvC